MANEFSYQDVMNEAYTNGVVPKKYDFVTNVETGEEWWVSDVSNTGVPTLTSYTNNLNNQLLEYRSVNNLPKLTHKPEVFINQTEEHRLILTDGLVYLGWPVYFNEKVVTGNNTVKYRLFENTSTSLPISADPSVETGTLKDYVGAVELIVPNGIYRQPAPMLVNKKIPKGSKLILVAYDSSDTVISELSLNSTNSLSHTVIGSLSVTGIELVSQYISSSDSSLIDITDRTSEILITDFVLKITYDNNDFDLKAINGVSVRTDGLYDLMITPEVYSGKIIAGFIYEPNETIRVQINRVYNVRQTNTNIENLEPPEPPPPPVYEAHWRMNETSGLTFNDELGEFHATIGSGLQLNKVPLVNRPEPSIQGTGIANSVATIADSPLLRPRLNDYSISGWVTWSTAGGTLFSRTSGTDGIVVSLASGSVKIEENANPSQRAIYFTSSTTYTGISPVHLIFQRRTVDGVTRLQIFANGILMESSVVPTLIDHNQETTITLFNNLVGLFSNIRYNARESYSDTEALELFTSESQIVAMPRLLGMSGATSGASITDIVVSTTNPNIVIARASNKKMTKSIDGGLTWSEIDLSARPVPSTSSETYNPVKRHRLINISGSIWIVVFPGGQVGRSTDDCTSFTWTTLLSYGSIETNLIFNITYCSATGVIFLDHNNTGLEYVSRNVGLTWTSSSDSYVVRRGSSPAGTWLKAKYDFTSGFLYRSTNDGVSYSSLSRYLNSGNSSNANKITFLGKHNGTAWVIPFENGYYNVSLDEGLTFTQSNNQQFTTNISLAFGSGSVWIDRTKVSTNNGLTWATRTAYLGGEVYGYGSELIDHNSGGFFLYTRDNANTWIRGPANPNSHLYYNDYSTPQQIAVFVNGAWLLHTKSGYMARFTPPS